MIIETGIVIAVVIGLTEVVKRATKLNNRFAPLVSLGFGLVISFFILDGEIATRLFEGIIAGLSASGLYSGVKAQR